ncbi:MAG: CPBP family intramembrane glutamic endopeptidase [Myxococcota bacterium]
MSEEKSFIAESNAGAYMLFFGALALFVVTWFVLDQSLSLHWTAVGSQFIAILGAALIFRVMAGDDAADWPAWDRLGTGPLGLLVLAIASVSLALTSNTVTSLLVELVPAFRDFAETYKKLIDEMLVDTTGWTKVLAIVSVSVVAPLCEESLFRGTILQEQRKVESFAVAIVLNGFLFSVLHFNPIGMISLWVVGAFFAHLTLSANTMWMPILAHAFFNFFNSAILPALAPEVSEVETKYGASELGIVLVILAPLTAGLWALTVYLIRRHRSKRDGADHAQDLP